MTTTIMGRSSGQIGGREPSPTSQPQPIHIIHHSDIERERYEGLLALPTDQLRERAVTELRGELGLDADRRREAVHRRLAAWLELDPEDARIIARVWDEAAAQLEAEESRERFQAECDAMLHGLRFEDFTRLAEFMPWVTSRLGLGLFASAARAPEDVVAA